MELAKVGEFGLIDLLNRRMIFSPEGVIAGIGDDAAVLKPSGGQWQLFATDMLIEGVHFRLDWSGYYAVGYKALAVNISDIAAMGGQPTHAVISIGIPEGAQVEDITELYRGLKDIAEKYQVNLVGGDTVKSPERVVINIALLGEVPEGKAIYRSGAKPGDIIYTTGYLGTSAAGLHLLQHFQPPFTDSQQQIIKAHILPEPCVKAGVLLSQLEGVTALDDNSDGLAAELREICRASSVGCLVWERTLPIASDVQKMSMDLGLSSLDWVLNGGEDYELLFTVQPEKQALVEDTLRQAGIQCTAIGIITSTINEIKLEYLNGNKELLTATGYNHFK